MVDVVVAIVSVAMVKDFGFVWRVMESARS